jgi:hypothetical protein
MSSVLILEIVNGFFHASFIETQCSGCIEVKPFASTVSTPLDLIMGGLTAFCANRSLNQGKGLPATVAKELDAVASAEAAFGRKDEIEETACCPSQFTSPH